MKYSISYLKKISKKHPTILGFSRSEDKKIYHYIKNNKTLHYLFKEKIPHPKGRVQYTKKYLKKLFAPYKFKKDARKDNNGAYQVAKKKWPEVLSHLIDYKPGIKKYHLSVLKEIAKDCNSRIEFQRKNSAAYNAALKRGLLTEICSHMKPAPTRNSIGEEAARYIFEKLLGVKFKRKKNFLGKMELDGYNNKLKIAFEYQGEQHYKQSFFNRTENSLADQKKRDRLKKKECKKQGIFLIEIPYNVSFKKMPNFVKNIFRIHNVDFFDKDIDLSKVEINSEAGLWSRKSVLEVAKKCKIKSEFREKYSGASTFAKKHGFYEEATAHMTVFSKPKNFWTKDKVFEVAQNSKNFSDFANHAGATDYAYTFNFMNEVRKKVFGHRIKDEIKVEKKRKEIIKILKKSKTLSIFRHKYKSYFLSAIRQNMQKEIIKYVIVQNPDSLYLK